MGQAVRGWWGLSACTRSFSQAGFGDAVAAIRAAHQAGDRAAALAAVPDQMIGAIDVVGSPVGCQKSAWPVSCSDDQGQS